MVAYGAILSHLLTLRFFPTFLSDCENRASVKKKLSNEIYIGNNIANSIVSASYVFCILYIVTMVLNYVRKISNCVTIINY